MRTNSYRNLEASRYNHLETLWPSDEEQYIAYILNSYCSV